jgi:hypothetical protein
MIKFLRTIRFDDSDDRVFDVGAAAGEWAVSGAFAFAHLAEPDIKGKVKQAFANGFLGLTSFGRATFATVGEATDDDRENIEGDLARHFIDAYGAPDLSTALPTARDEVAFIEELCRDLPLNTVFTVRRVLVDGAVKEEFRRIEPPRGEAAHARVWTVERDETDMSATDPIASTQSKPA